MQAVELSISWFIYINFLIQQLFCILFLQVLIYLENKKEHLRQLIKLKPIHPRWYIIMQSFYYTSEVNGSQESSPISKSD